MRVLRKRVRADRAETRARVARAVWPASVRSVRIMASHSAVIKIERCFGAEMIADVSRPDVPVYPGIRADVTDPRFLLGGRIEKTPAQAVAGCARMTGERNDEIPRAKGKTLGMKDAAKIGCAGEASSVPKRAGIRRHGFERTDDRRNLRVFVTVASREFQCRQSRALVLR